jgi:hypothetical protein
MPVAGKQSRCAKDKHERASTAFRKHAMKNPSPEHSGSEYHTSGNDTDVSIRVIGCSNERESNNKVEASMEALQHLYAVFLPPQLCPQAKTREKCCKVTNRPHIYTR